MSDPRIELTKLYGVYCASQQLEHAFRSMANGVVEWQGFAPTHFVYAYFAFNGIYAYDWETTVDTDKLTPWERDENGRMIDEKEQIKKLLAFCYEHWHEQSACRFAACLANTFGEFEIHNPSDHLTRIVVTNADKKLREAAKQFPSYFRIIANSNTQCENHKQALISALAFVKQVRNNVFHGSKTQVQMLDKDQQMRLLIYKAILNATMHMFFTAIQATDLRWIPVPTSFMDKADT